MKRKKGLGWLGIKNGIVELPFIRSHALVVQGRGLPDGHPDPRDSARFFHSLSRS